MIPILYNSDETQFTSNGIGRLAECTSCKVTEVRNGEYECEFTYPITGKYYDAIQPGIIISCTHDDHGDRQPFIIYSKSAPMDGRVTFNAHHKTYLLNHVALNAMTAESVAAAFDAFKQQGIPSNPFDFWTDVTTPGTFRLDVPSSVRGVLGGVSGSILDVYGGEYEWDNMTVKLHAHRGQNSGVTIRYGKNLVDIDQNVDYADVHNAVFPYWYSDVEDGGGVLVTLPELYVTAEGVTDPLITILDLSERWEEAPTVDQLRTAANAYLRNNRPWNPKENIKISFVQLWQTEDYKDVAALQRLSLCDRVNVYYPELGITVEDIEIIRTVYDVLKDRYDEMELGEARATLTDTVMESVDTAISKMLQRVVNFTALERSIAEATEKITGGAGGVFKWKFNANGEPIELLVLDTGDESTAVNVWRWNSGGLGHSSNGYDGPYDDLAITMDGKINASAIATGTMLANYIKGGVLTLGGSGENAGELIMLDISGDRMGRWSRNGFFTTGYIQNAKLYTYDGATRQADVFLVNGRIVMSDRSGGSSYTHGMMSELLPNYDAICHAVNPAATGGTIPNTGAIPWSDLRGLDIVPYHALFIGAFFKQSDGSYVYDRCFQVLGSDATDDGGILIRFGGNYRQTVEMGGYLFSLKTDAIIDPSKKIYIGSAYPASEYIEIQYITTDRHYVNVVANGLRVNGIGVQLMSSSSKRYKRGINTITDKALDPHRLYDLLPKQFVYNDDAPLQYKDMAGLTIPGFIAEDVAEIYPSAVIHDDDGRVESWDERRIIPGMLALIQEQKQTIESLQARVEKLESLINTLL